MTDKERWDFIKDMLKNLDSIVEKSAEWETLEFPKLDAEERNDE